MGGKIFVVDQTGRNLLLWSRPEEIFVGDPTDHVEQHTRAQIVQDGQDCM